MNDDRIVKLLEEMRDLQREQLAGQRQALQNQAESIEIQREVSATYERRMRWIPRLFLMVLGLLVLSMAWLWLTARH